MAAKPTLLSPDFNRRAFLSAAGLAAAGGVLPIRRAWADAPADPVVRIGYIPITDAAALLVAYDKGYFKAEGLDAAKPILLRGWPPLIEAFAAHKFNLVHLLKPIPIWMRYNNHFPVKMMAWAHTNGSALVVGRDTRIETFAELAGKQVAVPFWYSMHNIILQIALAKYGVKPVIKRQGDKLAADECNLLVMAPPDMPPALAARKIDAYIVAEPFDALGELKVGAKVLRFTGDIWKDHPCCVVCMHEADAVDPARKAWTQAVLNAIVKAQIYISHNKAEVARLLSSDGKGYLPVPAPVVIRAMTFYNPKAYADPPAIQHEAQWKNGRIDFQGWPYPSATRLIVADMKKTVVAGDTKFLDNLAPEFVAKDLVNYDFVKAALQKYPAWKDDPSVNPGDPFHRTEIIEV